MSQNHRHLAELSRALQRAKYTSADVSRLSGIYILERIKPVLSGMATIQKVMHLIDGDADPCCRLKPGWQLVQHRKIGMVEWDPAKIKFFLSEEQKDGRLIRGNQLYSLLENQPVLNECVQDYLTRLTNMDELFPDEWEDHILYFWGTIYRDEHNQLRVPRIVGKRYKRPPEYIGARGFKRGRVDYGLVNHNLGKHCIALLSS